MTPQAVRQSLLEEPDKAKEIRLNDGSRIVVRQREQWAIGTDILGVWVEGLPYPIAFRNIACIRFVPRSGGRRARQT